MRGWSVHIHILYRCWLLHYYEFRFLSSVFVSPTRHILPRKHARWTFSEFPHKPSLFRIVQHKSNPSLSKPTRASSPSKTQKKVQQQAGEILLQNLLKYNLSHHSEEKDCNKDSSKSSLLKLHNSDHTKANNNKHNNHNKFNHHQPSCPPHQPAPPPEGMGTHISPRPTPSMECAKSPTCAPANQFAPRPPRHQAPPE